MSMLFVSREDYDSRQLFGFAGVGCFHSQEHVKRPGGRAETQWVRGYYQWIQCLRGRGEVVIDGQRIAIEPGQGMLLVPGEPHEYYPLSESWEVDWVVFYGDKSEEFIKREICAASSQVYSVSAPEELHEAILALYRMSCSDDPLRLIKASAMVYRVLLGIYLYVIRASELSIEARATRLRRIFGYIDSHYGEEITLNQLARLMDYTPQYLCRLFKSLTGSTIFRYIAQVRINKSKELLLNRPELPIKEIAALSGFTDTGYFCSTFRKLEGVTPGQFRAGYGLQAGKISLKEAGGAVKE